MWKRSVSSLKNPYILVKDKVVPDQFSEGKNVWSGKEVSVFHGNSEYNVVGLFDITSSDSIDTTPVDLTDDNYEEPDFDFLEQELDDLQERLKKAKLAKRCAADYMWKQLEMAELEYYMAYRAWHVVKEKHDNVQADWEKGQADVDEYAGKLKKQRKCKRISKQKAEAIKRHSFMYGDLLARQELRSNALKVATRDLARAKTTLYNARVKIDDLRTAARDLGPKILNDWTLELVKRKAEMTNKDLLSDDEQVQLEVIVCQKQMDILDAYYLDWMQKEATDLEPKPKRRRTDDDDEVPQMNGSLSSTLDETFIENLEEELSNDELPFSEALEGEWAF